jgi:hypothetical protein
VEPRFCSNPWRNDTVRTPGSAFLGKVGASHVQIG